MKTLLAATLPLLFLATSCTTLTDRRDLYSPNEGETGVYHRKLEALDNKRERGSWWPAHPKALQSGRAAYLEDEG